MPKRKETLSDSFFKGLVGKKVKIFLSSGIALSGTLKDFDQESLVISGKTESAKPSLVQRNLVSTVHEDTDVRSTQAAPQSALRRR